MDKKEENKKQNYNKNKKEQEKVKEQLSQTKKEDNLGEFQVVPKRRKKYAKKIILTAIVAVLLITIAIITYNAATVNVEYKKNEKNIDIPIFVYHDIVKEESEVQHDYMQTTVKTFEEQIKGLQKLGYHIISFDDLAAYQKGEKALTKRTCLITFDDGCLGVYENAYPIIKKYKIPVTAFVIDSNVGTSGAFSWEQAKEMEESGLVKIASHGKRHIEYHKESRKTIQDETNEAYKHIEKKLGKRKQRIFCYPYGLYSEENIEALKEEGYIQLLTDNKVNNSKKLNLNKLHRCYPLSDPVWKIMMKIMYRSVRYGG